MIQLCKRNFDASFVNKRDDVEQIFNVDTIQLDVAVMTRQSEFFLQIKDISLVSSTLLLLAIPTRLKKRAGSSQNDPVSLDTSTLSKQFAIGENAFL